MLLQRQFLQCGWSGDSVLCACAVPAVIRPAVVSADCTTATRLPGLLLPSLFLAFSWSWAVHLQPGLCFPVLVQQQALPCWSQCHLPERSLLPLGLLSPWQSLLLACSHLAAALGSLGCSAPVLCVDLNSAWGVETGYKALGAKLLGECEPYFMDTRVPGLPRRAQTPSRLLHASWAGFGQMSAARCCGVSLWVAGLPNAAHSPGTGPTARGACCEPGAARQAAELGSCPLPCLQVLHLLPRCLPALPYSSDTQGPCASGAGVAFFIPFFNICFPPAAFKAHEEEVRKKFRPIEQLKEEFEKLNVKMETDYEIMDKLISKFNSSASTLDEKVAALYDLEYYVHQVTKMHL